MSVVCYKHCTVQYGVVYLFNHIYINTPLWCVETLPDIKALSFPYCGFGVCFSLTGTEPGTPEEHRLLMRENTQYDVYQYTKPVIVQ